MLSKAREDSKSLGNTPLSNWANNQSKIFVIASAHSSTKQIERQQQNLQFDEQRVTLSGVIDEKLQLSRMPVSDRSEMMAW